MSYCLYCPETLEEAVALQQQTGGAYLAGGTVSLVNHHRGQDIGACQISLDRIPALRGITTENGMLRIGAYVTMDELEQSEAVKANSYALWQAAAEVGGPQIRNRATLGGNLAAASPSSDCATPLLAMDAVLCVIGAAGTRRIPLREFFLGRFRHTLSPEEIIQSIEIPLQPGAVSAFRKVGKRSALAVSCLNVAMVRSEASIAVAVGAAAPKAVYCEKTSALLSAGRVEEAAAALQTEICPIDDRWATASYRRTVSDRLLRAMLKETEERQ